MREDPGEEVRLDAVGLRRTMFVRDQFVTSRHCNDFRAAAYLIVSDESPGRAASIMQLLGPAMPEAKASRRVSAPKAPAEPHLTHATAIFNF